MNPECEWDQGAFRYWPVYLGQAQSHFFEIFKEQLRWRTESIVLFGQRRLVPRLVCWYADDGVTYRYSGNTQSPDSWHPQLLLLRDQLALFLSVEFNGVLGNYYRNGQDSMGWHRDNEPELGKTPIIASLSLGAPRHFRLRHRNDHRQVKLLLEPGSLLVMRKNSQRDWEHCLPKTKRHVGERINLTFRFVN